MRAAALAGLAAASRAATLSAKGRLGALLRRRALVAEAVSAPPVPPGGETDAASLAQAAAHGAAAERRRRGLLDDLARLDAEIGAARARLATAEAREEAVTELGERLAREARRAAEARAGEEALSLLPARRR